MAGCASKSTCYPQIASETSGARALSTEEEAIEAKTEADEEPQGHPSSFQSGCRPKFEKHHNDPIDAVSDFQIEFGDLLASESQQRM